MQIIKLKSVNPIPDGRNYYVLIGRNSTVNTINAETGANLTDIEMNDLVGCWPLIYFKSAVKGVIKLRRFYERAAAMVPNGHRTIDPTWQGHMLHRDHSACIMSEELFHIFNEVLAEQLAVFRGTKIADRVADTVGQGKPHTLLQLERYVKRNTNATMANVYNVTTVYAALYCVNLTAIHRAATPPVATIDLIETNWWRGIRQSLGVYAACFFKAKEPLKNLMDCFVADAATISRKFLAAPMIRTRE